PTSPGASPSAHGRPGSCPSRSSWLPSSGASGVVGIGPGSGPGRTGLPPPPGCRGTPTNTPGGAPPAGRRGRRRPRGLGRGVRSPDRVTRGRTSVGLRVRLRHGAREVVHDHLLVADHPRVVSGRADEDVAGAHLALGAVVHPDVHAALNDEAVVVN